jgi:pyruvate,water dikinase
MQIDVHGLLELPARTVPSSDFGLKACNIARLSMLADRIGFTVPAGFVLSPDLLDGMWRPLGLEPASAFDTYAAVVERCDLPTARAWQRRTALVDLPDELAHTLQLAYQSLVASTGSPAVVVRSSFHAEDRAGLSCAGIFESVPDVSGLPMLARAVRTVYGSLFAERTIHYLNAARVPIEPRMAIIVQHMLSGAGWCGGVAHSSSPDLDTPDLILIAATPDLHGVTSGSTCPEEYLVHRPNLLSGRPALIHCTAGTSTAQQGFAFDQFSVVPLALVLVALEHVFAEPRAVVWARAPDGRLFVLQARPMPARTRQTLPALQSSGSGPLVTGLAVGHGHFTGVVRRTDSVEEAAHCGPQHVLVTRLTNPDWEAALAGVGALVTQSGGRTSHAARLARERGKLAVVACGEHIAHLRSGERVTLLCNDGLEGAIYAANQLKPAASAPCAAGATLRISNPFGAFTLARQHRPAVVEVEIDCVLLAIRIPADVLNSTVPPSAQIAARIAGYPDVPSFVIAKLRDALAIVCVAFPDARVRVLPLAAAPATTSVDQFQQLLDSAVTQLAERFSFQVASFASR